jgi:hypothetical protein
LTQPAAADGRGWWELIFFYNNLVIIDFDNAFLIGGQHSLQHLIYHAFIDKSREIVYFIDLVRVDTIAGFIDEPDLNVRGKMVPERVCVQVKHGSIGFLGS